MVEDFTMRYIQIWENTKVRWGANTPYIRSVIWTICFKTLSIKERENSVIFGNTIGNNQNNLVIERQYGFVKKYFIFDFLFNFIFIFETINKNIIFW